MIHWAVTAAWILTPIALAQGAEQPVGADRVPVIVTGWDSPNTRQFSEGIRAFEEWGVFDGTTVRAERLLPSGERASAINVFSREPWEWSEFAEAVADLQSVEPTTCTENYLMVFSNPGDVDWFDDAGWASIVDHWRLLARLAHQGNLRGLLFDAEPYTPPHSQYLYSAQPGRDAHTFDEYRAKARQRGREVMEAVSEECPEITLFSYRLFSDLLGHLDSGSLSLALETDGYGLLPSFVDGWLDVAPPGLTLIEGTEAIGYLANSQAEYDSAYTRLRLRFHEFLAPEHRSKVLQHVLIGQSLYLDAYINPPSSFWYIDRTGATAAARLAANLASAIGAADGLVWLYGEKARWWANSGDTESPLWPEALDGAVEAIQRAKDPAGFTARFWSSMPPPANLLPNPDFASAEGGGESPDGWFPWQVETSHGVISTSEGTVELRGVTNGVVGVEVPVQSLRVYAVRVLTRREGHGLASLNIGWKTAEGVWTATAQNRCFVGSSGPDPDGWIEIGGLVQVPASADVLVFMPHATGQLSEADRCWFRQPHLADVGE